MLQLMEKQELEYVLSALEYGLNNCKSEGGSIERHYNKFANAIELIKDELYNNQQGKKYYLSRLVSNHPIGGKIQLEQLVYASSREKAREAVKKSAIDNGVDLILEIRIHETIIGE